MYKKQELCWSSVDSIIVFQVLFQNYFEEDLQIFFIFYL